MTAPASSEVRYAIVPVSWSGDTHLAWSEAGNARRFAGVSMIEGATAFAVTPVPRVSSAMASD